MFNSIRQSIRNWAFSWWIDPMNGDVTFCIANWICFTKFNEHTLVAFGRNKTLKPAPKHLDTALDAYIGDHPDM